jgi:hypothetical protein
LGVAAPANDQAQLPLVAAVPATNNNYEECLACQ